jgi:hypothetical protein
MATDTALGRTAQRRTPPRARHAKLGVRSLSCLSLLTFRERTGGERIVGHTMIYLILGLIAIELYFQVRALTAVVGSRQRYVSLSLRRLTSWTINLAFVAEGLVFLATNQAAEGIWYLAFGIFGIFLELRGHRNDDDWFNGRGKKITRGIRRLASRPRRQYVPAFG